MDDEKILKLRRPIRFADETYDTLTLREPTAGELERATARGDGLKMVIDLISMVAGVPRPVAERMGARDMKEASEFISGFTGDGPQNGPTQ